MVTTLQMLHLFERKYRFKPVIFINSTKHTYSSLIKQLNLTLFTVPQVNSFHMPYLKAMFQKTSQRVLADFYGYMNNRVLLNPAMMKEMRAVLKEIRTKKITEQVAMGAKVLMIDTAQRKGSVEVETERMSGYEQSFQLVVNSTNHQLSDEVVSDDDDEYKIQLSRSIKIYQDGLMD